MGQEERGGAGGCLAQINARTRKVERHCLFDLRLGLWQDVARKCIISICGAPSSHRFCLFDIPKLPRLGEDTIKHGSNTTQANEEDGQRCPKIEGTGYLLPNNSPFLSTLNFTSSLLEGQIEMVHLIDHKKCDDPFQQRTPLRDWLVSSRAFMLEEFRRHLSESNQRPPGLSFGRLPVRCGAVLHWGPRSHNSSRIALFSPA